MLANSASSFCPTVLSYLTKIARASFSQRDEGLFIRSGGRHRNGGTGLEAWGQARLREGVMRLIPRCPLACAEPWWTVGKGANVLGLDTVSYCMNKMTSC